MKRALLAFLLVFALPAFADVDTEHHLVETTGYTLAPGEIKLGFNESDVGVTDRLQLGTVILLDAVTFANLAAKYRVFTNDSVSIAVQLRGGLLASNLFQTLKGSYGIDGQVTGTFNLARNLYLHATAGGDLVYFNNRYVPLIKEYLPHAFAWPSLQGELEWDVTRRQILFLTVNGPLSYFQLSPGGNHEFQARALAATVGYQLSLTHWNFRFNVGCGPGLSTEGFTTSVDMYWRF